MNKILKIAHRGASGYEPENTLAAFKKAMDIGVDGIELDVHLSKDGEIIVIHDETIDRTTNGFGFVNQLTLSEINQFIIDGKHEITTLNEVLDLVKNTISVNIELKSVFCVEKVVILIEKYVSDKNWDYENFIVSSFDWDALEKVYNLNKKIPIGVLTYNNLDDAIAFAKQINAYSIHPHFKMLDKEIVQKIQENNFKIFTWTVNELAAIQQVKSTGVDGIISDFTDRI
jgi:glycerophosphoryl diester phosphodiesterase